MRLTTSALLLLSALPAAAQTPTSDWVFGANGEDIVLELGAGIRTRPEYEGSDDYTLRPWPIVELGFLRLPVLNRTFGGGPDEGVKFSPSFRIISERDGDDELAGMEDVDLAVEVGGKVSYRYGNVRGLVVLRRGFGGHDGLIGEVGIDAIAEPLPPLTVSLGPRLYFASDDYLDTYLGVTPAESAASGLPAFDPDGGLKGVGASAELAYALNRHWTIRAEAGYERLVGDAADSPIARLGSRNQFTAAAGLSYRFGLNLFD